MDSRKECDIDLGYMECENHATGRKNGRGGWRDFDGGGKDVEETVAWENGGKKETS
jgi:hypothetical protein